MAGFGVVVLLVVVGTTIWVGVDATRREWGGGLGPGSWVVFCLLFWIVAFPVYLVKRGKAPLKDGIAPAAPTAAPDVDAMYRECPYCKEPMRRDAGTCPHCRKESEPWRFHEGRWWARDAQGVWQWLDDHARIWRPFANDGEEHNPDTDLPTVTGE